jgi:tryptophanyl-tRNA synthetase
MTALIIELETVTTLDLPPDRILRKAAEAELTHVVVIGVDPDGEEFFASSIASGPEVVWMLERAKLALLRMADPE